MLSLTIIIVLVLIIIILAVISGLFYYHKQNNDLVEQLTKRLDLFQQDNIEEMIDQIADTKLAGATLNDFKKDKNAYLQIIKKQLPQMQAQLLDYAEKNANLQVWSVHRELKSLNQKSLQQEKLLKKLKNSLSNLFDHIQKNQADFNNVDQKAKKLQTQLQNNMVHYQEAYAPLQDQLAQITQQLPQINELVVTGDALKAHQLLEQQQVNLSKFQTISEQVLERGINLETDFKPEIKELEKAAQKLQIARINLEDPQINTELDNIKAQIKELKDLLAQLKVTDFDQLEQNINERLNYLYDRISQEWSAQKKVQKSQLVLADFIQHARRQNRLLSQNISRLKKHYVINDDDQQLALSSQQKIEQISQHYQELVKAMKQPQGVIYSKIWHDFQQASQQLKEIEQEQKRIAESFDGLYQGESVGWDNLQQISQHLHQLKHKLDVMRLPGLPEKYRNNYQMVSDEAQSLQQLLQTRPVNVEEVTKQMFVVQEDLNNLEQQTQNLWADAQITGRLLQYANRYVENHPKIQQAANLSQDLYDQQFNYHQARLNISQALEQVEPGAAQRISDLYYAENKD